MGQLAKLYQLGTIAYIGGGFGKGIHNILEAAVYGIPVLFGPNYGRFAEAVELIGMGVARSVSDTDSLSNAFTDLLEPERALEVSQAAHEYFRRHRGATDLIYDYICRERFLSDEPA